MKKPAIYRKPMNKKLFEEEFTLSALSKMGNLLEQLTSLVDFEMFRPALEDVLVKKDCKKSGRTSANRCCSDVQGHQYLLIPKNSIYRNDSCLIL